MHKTVRTALLLTLGATAAIAHSNDPAVQCVDGLYIILARGTSESPGPGHMVEIAERLVERIPDSVIYPLIYPASFTNPDMLTSFKNGSDAARAAITDYAKNCPDGKVALFGYSQGAFVFGNALCGNDGFHLAETGVTDIAGLPLLELFVKSQTGKLYYEPEPGIDTEMSRNVISAVLFGDPSFDASPSFTVGDATGQGLLKRDWATCDKYKTVLRAYCDKGDIFCDSKNGYVYGAHEHYVQLYGEDAIKFTIEQWNKATGDNVEVDAGGPLEGYGINIGDNPADRPLPAVPDDLASAFIDFLTAGPPGATSTASLAATTLTATHEVTGTETVVPGTAASGTTTSRTTDSTSGTGTERPASTQTGAAAGTMQVAKYLLIGAPLLLAVFTMA